MRRRDFLHVAGTFFAAASLGGLSGCGGDDDGAPSVDAGPDGGTALRRFPQGLASGDPRPTSVVLWTRAVPDAGTGDVAVKVEVASDEAFATIVVMQDVTATLASDHTVRVIVTGLAPDRFYHYRFTAGGDTITGRTRTAPDASADVPVRFALVNCQDYAAGRYDAYKLLVAEDEARAEADQLRYVAHVGDFIYETRGDGFQAALDADFRPITVMNPDGTARVVPPFPSGGGMTGPSNWAKTVDDYRHLYKLYASDPDLMAARARTPFIHTWDDHEFTNDCWQSQANYTDTNSLDEPAQRRRLAASQAWFEYMPVQLTDAPGVTGVTQHAHDFTATTVDDAAFTTPDADNFVPEPNNVAAIGAITLYRSFRFGKHVELLVTDQRSYRSDHAIPEDFAHASLEYLDVRNVLPAQDLLVMDAGAQANGGAPPDTVGLNAFPNPRRTSPPGTMLGRAQKAWWKDSMKMSTATWKVWANQVPFMRFFIPKGPTSLIVDRLMDGDAWDGYAWERRELTTYLRDQDIKNVLVVTGDIHAHFAGTVAHDFEAAAPVPIATEFIVAGVSSNSLFSFYESASRGAIVPADVRAIVTYDASGIGGSRFVENMNLLLVHGTTAANKMAMTNDRAMALALSDRTINPHLVYADTNAQGYGTVLVTATQAEVTLTTVARPIGGEAAVKRRARFVVPKDNPAGMTGPMLDGTPPFPL